MSILFLVVFVPRCVSCSSFSLYLDGLPHLRSLCQSVFILFLVLFFPRWVTCSSLSFFLDGYPVLSSLCFYFWLSSWQYHFFLWRDWSLFKVPVHFKRRQFLLYMWLGVLETPSVCFCLYTHFRIFMSFMHTDLFSGNNHLQNSPLIDQILQITRSSCRRYVPFIKYLSQANYILRLWSVMFLMMLRCMYYTIYIYSYEV